MPINTLNIIPILIVEDSAPDYETIIRAFKKLNINNPTHHCETGDDALDFLYKRNAYADSDNVMRPGIILLDLNLPGTDGRDVLKEIKNNPDLKSIPVIILTTSISDKDINECYLYGANSYMAKPVDWKSFFETMEHFKSYWLETVMIPNHTP